MRKRLTVLVHISIYFNVFPLSDILISGKLNYLSDSAIRGYCPIICSSLLASLTIDFNCKPTF